MALSSWFLLPVIAPAGAPPPSRRWCWAWVLFAVLMSAAPAPAPGQGPRAQEPISPIPPPPAANPLRVALGERLFADPRLSRGNVRACIMCHDVGSNGADASGRGKGLDGQPLPLTTLTVFNAALNFRLNWEGNERSLEDEADAALRSPELMGTTVEEVLGKLKADPELVRLFHAAYGGGPDRTRLLDAIATYERTLLTPDSRFDRWLRGDAAALTADEQEGYQLFKSVGCVSCHQGVNIGGNLFERHGIFRPLGRPKPEILRVPSLRNAAALAPYFHDGSAATLRKAVQAMAGAQLGRALSDSQVDRIIAFLRTLTGRYRGNLVRAP